MPVELEMRIGGGYAFVVGQTRYQFDVASIVPNAATHVLHPLIITLGPNATCVPDPLDPIGPDGGWNLSAHRLRMEVWPGGQVPRGLGARVTPPSAEDRAEMLPDIAELGRSPLSPAWRTRIGACLTLRAGLVEIDRATTATGIFQLRHPTRAPKPPQRMPHGITGTIYRIADASAAVNTIQLAVFPLDTPDEAILNNEPPLRRWIITPRAGTAVKLQVDSHEPPKEMQPGMDLEEFRIFYRLLNPETPMHDQYVPRWNPRGDPPTSPGSECPPGYYDDQN